LTELVTAGESQGIRDREHQSNDCRTISPGPATMKVTVIREALTHKRQPYKMKAHNRHDRQCYPQRRLTVQREPEEPLVRCVHQLPAWFIGLGCTFEYPVGVPRCGVDLVPPAEAYKAAAGDVLEVVEVGGQEEDGDDEDEDEVLGEEEAEEEVDKEGG